MSREILAPILDAGEEAGCLNLSQFSAAVQELELDEEELEALYAEVEERGISLSDDCGRQTTRRRDLRQRRPGGRDDRFAPAVPERGGSLPAAERRRGGRAREEDRARRRRGEEPDDQLEPPPRRLDREEVPGSRAVAARPDPGGRDRTDPRGREVRLAPRLQVLDLRDLVDPPGGTARRRQQVAHDSHPRPHRRPRAEDRPGGARADGQARPPADRRGDLRGIEDLAEAPARGPRRRRARSRASTSRSATTTTRRSATSSGLRRAASRKRSRSA